MDHLSALLEIWDNDKVSDWLRQPSKALNGEIPLDLIRDGDCEALEEAIDAILEEAADS